MKKKQIIPAGPIDRRTFNKLALGAGVSLSMGGLLNACFWNDESRGNGASEQKTLHFSLDHLPDDSVHTLDVGGQKYVLSRHNETTLAQAHKVNVALARLPGGPVTHYANDVRLSKDKPHFMSLTTQDPQRGTGLVYTAMHVPAEGLTQARTQLQTNPHPLLGASTLSTAGNVCTMSDEIADDFVTGFKAAQSILWHHPDIATTNADAAARIAVLMEKCAEVLNLAMSICEQGPAYQYDPDYLDGWCVLKPLQNFDGTPMLDAAGEQMYDYVFSDRTNEDMKPAIQAMLELIKNDTELAGLHYQVRYKNDSPEVQKALGDTGTRNLQSGGVKLSCSFDGYHHNVAFTGVQFNASDSTIQMNVWNENFIWYGVYAEYLDADGNPMNWKDLGMESNLEPELSWANLETDTCHYQDIIAAPPTVFGLPIIPLPTTFSMKLPAGASGIRVSLRGPGAHGSVNDPLTLSLGIALTTLIQFGIPMWFIYKATGVDETQSLSALFGSKAVRTKAASVLFHSYSLFSNPDAVQGMAVTGSFASLLAGVLDTIFNLLLSKEIPALTKWIVEKFSTEEAEFSVPFAGWLARIICNCGTVGDIIAMFAEIGTNPLVIENKITVTSSVKFTINYDPDDYQFPEEAVSYQVIIHLGNAHPHTQTFQLSAEERSKATITPTVENVPVTGKNEKFEVVFLSASGWYAAYVSGTYLNKATSNWTAIEVPAVTIVEAPMPVDANTVYWQHRKLEYNQAGENYHWNEASPAPPAIEVTGGCLPGAYCGPDNISVWVPGGMLGYSWKANMAGRTDCHGEGGEELHYFKNVNLREADANTGMKFSSCGFQSPAPVGYETLSHDLSGGGRHFYLDSVSTSQVDPEYHLRRLALDNTGAFTVSSQSWGRFRIRIDRIAVLPTGYVVGISTASAKLAILKLPGQATADAHVTNNAVILSGQGTESDAALHTPVALTVSHDGAILVLENDTGRIKAFDVDGKPWRYFGSGEDASSVLDISESGLSVTYLDVALDPSGLIYVLSVVGDARTQSNYRLDVYELDGTRLMRNTHVSVARLAVDKFRRVYSLNYETIKQSPIVEPSVSVWMPNV